MRILDQLASSTSGMRRLTIVTVVIAVLIAAGCLAAGSTTVGVLGVVVALALIGALVYVTAVTRRMRP